MTLSFHIEFEFNIPGPGRGSRIILCVFAGLLFVDLLWCLASCVYGLTVFERKSWKQSTNKGTQIYQTWYLKQSKWSILAHGDGKGYPKINNKIKNANVFFYGAMFLQFGGLNGSMFTEVIWKMVIKMLGKNSTPEKQIMGQSWASKRPFKNQ